MNAKYTPLREELTLIETLRYMPTAAAEVKAIKEELRAKYGPDVIIEKHEFEKQEWSWRCDSHYTVDVTEYRVKCMRTAKYAGRLKASR